MSTWRGVVCPRCGGMVAQGHAVVLCPKCSSPNHVECWRDHGGTCGACGTAAETGDPAREAAPAPGDLATNRLAATDAPDTAEALDVAAPTSLDPRAPTPSLDTEGAAMPGPSPASNASTGPLSAQQRQDPFVRRALTAFRSWVSWPPLALQPARPRVEWMLPLSRWSATSIAPGMVVCDSSGRRLGVVARVYAGPRATGGAAAGRYQEGTQAAARATPEAPEDEALLEIRAGDRGRPSRRGKPLYLPVSAVHDVRGMTIRLWRAGDALAEDVRVLSPPERAGLQPRAAIPAPVYRPVLEWR